jgi:hypothetical protein
MDLETAQASEMQSRIRQKMRLQPKQAALGLVAIDLASQQLPSTPHASEPLTFATAIVCLAGMAWMYTLWRNKGSQSQ